MLLVWDWGDSTFADTAQSQIDIAIDGLSIPVNKNSTKFVDAATDPFGHNRRLFTPISRALNFSFVYDFSGPCGGLNADAGYFIWNCNSWWEDRVFAFAQFTPSAVLVPAAAWLFGTGILGLIGFSKRKAAMLRSA